MRVVRPFSALSRTPGGCRSGTCSSRATALRMRRLQELHAAAHEASCACGSCRGLAVVHEAAEDERYTIACAHVRIAVAEMLEENGSAQAAASTASHPRRMKDKIGLGQVRKKVNRLGCT
jgi:hypothetical protein